MSKLLSKEVSKEVSKRESNNLLFENLLRLYLENKNKLNENQSAELEIKFATRGIKPITKINFDNVIQQLLSNNFKFAGESKYYLRITSDNIRTEIIGIQNIQEYCRTNNLPTQLPNEGYVFMEKNLHSIGDTIIQPVNFDDFNFRASYNIETSLKKNSHKINKLMETWSTNKKFYRFINRHRMIHDEFPVAIDLSIVKETSRSNRNEVGDIKDINLFNKNEKYEIEIEVDNEMIDRVIIGQEPVNSKFLDKILKKVVKYVLCGLQETNYPISYDEQKMIQTNYLKLIKKENYKSEDGISTNDFIGPSSVTLQTSNIAPIDPEIKMINIRENYTVTDKADGDRKLLYIGYDGKIYLITTNMNIQFTGAETKNRELFNSLLDGEHIKHNKSGQYINLYAAFDLYYIGSKDIRSLEFFPLKADDIHSKFRLPLLKNLIKDLDPFLVNTKKLSPIRIEKKTFYETSDRQSIFVGCNTIMKGIQQGKYDYVTDGLIFTPTSLGVGLNYQSDIPKTHKATWQYSFKWKPVEFNTIDFLITTKKSSTGGEFIGNIFHSGMDTATMDQIVQYKTVILRVGFDEKKHGYINPCQTIIDDNYSSIDYNDSTDNYKPVQFFPTNPYDPEAGISNIPLKSDSTNEKQMFTEEGEIIEDNMIVEFRYDINRDKHWQWIPLRIRYDKTADYRSGSKNYGNAYPVAQSNWNSIHNPITPEMITTGNNIPTELADNDIYYNKYNSKRSTYTQPLRDFHNLFVKKLLIESVANVGDTLIDYAVGKGGDLPKWIASKLSFVFGLDLSRDNIVNRMDGVCARYLNYKKKYRLTPDVIPAGLFIQGNAGKNIKNLSAQYTEKGKQITQAIFGEGTNDETILGKGVAKSYGKAANGFNISSIQFALHYMFESSNTLQTFLTNLAECTQLGGYLIGTCFDGKKIFDLLKDKKQNESVVISDRSNNKLLEITKQYDSDEFPDNISCLGYGINVFQESINKTFREYLVNFDYLTQILENYGFIQLTTDEAEKMGLPRSIGSFKDLFDIMNYEVKRQPSKRDDYKTAYKMTAEQRKISFLNNYFIFKKVRNVDITDVKFSITHGNIEEDKSKTASSLIAQQEVKGVVETEKKRTSTAKTKKKLKLVSQSK